MYSIFNELCVQHVHLTIPVLSCRTEKLNAERTITDVECADIMAFFEDECLMMKHSACKCCRRVSMNISLNKKGYCTQKCSTLANKNIYLDKNALPIWKDRKNKIHYDVPNCLKSLSIAEKMLIQLISPIIPLYHLKYGVMGQTGHCCAFESDVVGFVNTLPRKKNDVTLLRVLKKVKAEIAGRGSDYELKAYRVRKQKIYEALVWLKEYNLEYKKNSINIDMTALDWLAGEEGTLEGIVIEAEDIKTTADNTAQNADIGPAPKQAQPPEGDIVRNFGYINESGDARLSETDENITAALREAVKASANKKLLSVDWPSKSSKPVDEYDENVRLFVGAFPWLFPGGIGDPKDYPGTLKEWGKHMLYYQDGRFAKDKFFSFFALNHITRMRNATHGQWFVENFHKGLPETLSEVQDKIREGDMSFINSLSYYNRSIRGSYPYWFKKRCELYQWINHHVEIGNGPPTMFITLSCAEYLWADVIDKIKERMEIAKEDTSECYIGSPKLHGIVNDYAIVVQEYFQKRVIKWLDTVGKKIFKIKHYWVRYEFAPGRGQIHAHLLAIPEDHDIYELCYIDKQQENGDALRTERMAQWAEQHLGLTASVDDNFNELKEEDQAHVSLRFKNVKDMPEESNRDFQMLMKEVQVHSCNGFCMREKDKR